MILTILNYATSNYISPDILQLGYFLDFIRSVLSSQQNLKEGTEIYYIQFVPTLGYFLKPKTQKFIFV